MSLNIIFAKNILSLRQCVVKPSGKCTFLLIRQTSTTPDTKSAQPPNPRTISTDMVGPPDPVSNLRRIVFRQPSGETKLEKRFRELRTEVQEWNQIFWTQHNSRFFQVSTYIINFLFTYSEMFWFRLSTQVQ